MKDQRPWKGLLRRLSAEGLLDDTTADQLARTSRQNETSLPGLLAATQQIPVDRLTHLMALEYGLPIIDLEALQLDRLPPAEDFPAALLRRLRALPLQRHGHHLSVAIDCPSTLASLDELRIMSGLTPRGVLARSDQLSAWLEDYLGPTPEALPIASPISSDIADNAIGPVPNSDATTSASLVTFIDGLLDQAVQKGASDIHFEPYEQFCRIRFRIDGVLHDMAHPPIDLRDRLTARLKIMARLDIAERRLPQDGSIKLKGKDGRVFDCRVNTLPTLHGEKVVLRLLDGNIRHWGLDSLGLSARQQGLYESALHAPQGLVLVTGPTGSGKTVTLYAGIGLLNAASRNICTIEDPVEIGVPGINQVNAQPRIGLDFASALRAFLRQDPDVLMVGEIRDRETAAIAMRAAQTGHLVLSTLHTNSASQTLVRLADMGIEPFNIANAVSLIIAQRLVRRLCDRCKRPESSDTDATTTHYLPVGCWACTRGFKGRLGVHEVVPLTARLRRAVLAQDNADELERQARREGHPDLRDCGMHKVARGLTSRAEIDRVCGD